METYAMSLVKRDHAQYPKSIMLLPLMKQRLKLCAQKHLTLAPASARKQTAHTIIRKNALPVANVIQTLGVHNKVIYHSMRFYKKQKKSRIQRNIFPETKNVLQEVNQSENEKKHNKKIKKYMYILHLKLFLAIDGFYSIFISEELSVPIRGFSR